MYRQIVFVPGGHGISFDGPGNKKLASVLTEAYSSGIAIVSHFCRLSCKAEEHIYCMGYASLYCACTFRSMPLISSTLSSDVKAS